jgi:hypothetical protein
LHTEFYICGCSIRQFLEELLEPSIHVDASYQVSVHMAKQFKRRRFVRNRPIRNKNWMWWSCLLTDRDELSNLHRGHSIDDSYQVSVVAMFIHLVSVVCHPFTFHILIFSSENPLSNDLKLGRKHLWKVLS